MTTPLQERSASEQTPASPEKTIFGQVPASPVETIFGQVPASPVESKGGSAWGLSGHALKIIAAVTMLIDHIGAGFLYEGVFRAYPITQFLKILYYVMRCVGRIAFPIYCFLLVEGYLHTKDVRKYLLRLSIFAFLSEIPFDLAFNRAVLEFSSQNVYFTLALGLLAITLYDRITKLPALPKRAGLLLGFVAAGAAILTARFLRTDYGMYGAAVIFILYFFRAEPVLRDACSAVILFICSNVEIFGFVDYILFRFYNGTRGRQPKYFYYVYYPGHLLLIVLVRYLCFGH